MCYESLFAFNITRIMQTLIVFSCGMVYVSVTHIFQYEAIKNDTYVYSIQILQSVMPLK